MGKQPQPRREKQRLSDKTSLQVGLERSHTTSRGRHFYQGFVGEKNSRLHIKKIILVSYDAFRLPVSVQSRSSWPSISRQLTATQLQETTQQHGYRQMFAATMKVMTLNPTEWPTIGVMRSFNSVSMNGGAVLIRQLRRIKAFPSFCAFLKTQPKLGKSNFQVLTERTSFLLEARVWESLKWFSFCIYTKYIHLCHVNKHVWCLSPGGGVSGIIRLACS